MRNVWQNPELLKSDWLKKAIDLRLSDMYLQEWHSQVFTKSSCILYRTFKINFELEKYLTLLNCRDRIIISRFRCRNIKIPVVSMGYANRNIQPINRLCTICNLNEIGDETHYILRCPALQTHRIRYISNYYIRNPDIAVAQIFQNNNVTTLKKLANFISVINSQFR